MRSPRMELRHLRYFVAVAEEEIVTRAAARLHVSQPPLTRQIHDLEDELGFPLFVRAGKTVRLTDAGRVFLEEARAILQRVEAGVTTARAVARGQRGELHVGYAPSPTVGLLSPALDAFRQSAPGVKVVLHDQSTPEMLAGLRDRRLHLALMMQPPRAAMRGVTFEPLGSHAMIVAVGRRHRFARRKSVTLADVVAEPVVAFARDVFLDYHALLARILGRSVRDLSIAEECDSGMSLITAVEAGRGVAIVIAGLADIAGSRLRYVPLPPSTPRAIVGVAWCDDTLTPLAESFLKVLRARCGTAKPTEDTRS